MHYVEKLFQSLQPLYNQPWFPYAIGVLGLIFAYSVYQSLKSLPKLVMYPIIMATVVIISLNWIYNRNEPEILTPVVNMIAQFLPTRGA
ncbi:hypothetical protein [Pelagicoccus albus]|uniref:Uncharacterized protein n=1 Tax=Pelagicoccus albus TaxID=415222 RepID=A0A7X1B894_9BACT|nr:hypothetical protein [Pelagicoccus albus]MBC2607396.1 hypothetical protein [Pelagicoccus albus]